MKRMLSILFGLLALAAAAVQPVQADTRSAQLLARLSAEMKALGRYGVTFELTAGDYRDTGRYVVDGECYYLRLGQAEVYCDGDARYELDPAKREVVIDTVDKQGGNLLDNPTHGFDFLDEQFSHAVAGERDGGVTVQLTPRDGKSSALGTIRLTLDAASGLPRAVLYDFDGETVGVTIRSIAPEQDPPARFDPAACAGYEIIDFR